MPDQAMKTRLRYDAFYHHPRGHRVVTEIATGGYRFNTARYAPGDLSDAREQSTLPAQLPALLLDSDEPGEKMERKLKIHAQGNDLHLLGCRDDDHIAITKVCRDQTRLPSFENVEQPSTVFEMCAVLNEDGSPLYAHWRQWQRLYLGHPRISHGYAAMITSRSGVICPDAS